MANAEELTTYDGSLTQADQETLVTVTQSTVADVDYADFDAPAPVDLSDVDLTKKAVTQTVNMTTVPTSIDMTGVGSVSYDSVATSDEVTNESLNRTAESLKTSVNTVLAGIDGKVESAINSLASAVSTSITKVKDDTNAAFSNIKTQMDDQVDDIEGKIDGAVAEINTALDNIRAKNIAQNQDIAYAINTTKSGLQANLNLLKTGIEELARKQQALDDVYLTDSDMAERISAVNALIETLRNADVDVVSALGSTVYEVNSLLRVNKKRVTMNTANGVYTFNLLAEGYPEFTDAALFSVEAEVIGSAQAQVAVTNKVAAVGTGGAVDLEVKSNGVHFVPQPIDGSVTPVTLLVTTSYAKIDPLSFNIDELDDSWLTAGNGTDTTSIPGA